jgi:hypothetical protein
MRVRCADESPLGGMLPPEMREVMRDRLESTVECVKEWQPDVQFVAKKFEP